MDTSLYWLWLVVCVYKRPIMIKAPFEIGQVLINKYSYDTAVVERLDYRDSWYVLLAVGDERHWLAASTVQHQGFIPIDSPASAFMVR